MTEKIKTNGWLMVGFVISLGRFLALPFLTLYLTDISLNSQQVGIIVGTPGLVSLLMGIVSGFLIKKYGPIQSVVTALIFISIGFFGYFEMKSFLYLEMCALIVGIGLALYNPAVMTLVSKKNNSALGINYWLTNLAGMLGPLIGALFVAKSPKFPFVIYSILSISVAVIVIFTNIKNFGKNNNNPHSGHGSFDFDFQWVNKGLIIILISYMSFFIIETQLDSSLALHFQSNFGSGANILALVMSTMTVTLVVSQPIVLALQKKITSKYWLDAGVALFLIGVTGLMISESMITIVVFSVIFATGESFYGPKMNQMIGESVDEKYKPMAFSLSSSAGNLSFFIGPILGINLFHYNKFVLAVLVILISFLAAISLLIFDRFYRKAR